MQSSRNIIDTLLINLLRKNRNRLKHISSLPEITKRHSNNRSHPILRNIKPLGLGNPLNISGNRLITPRPEPKDRTPTLDRRNKLRRIIARQNKPRRMRILFHCPAKRLLRLSSQSITLIKKNNLKLRPKRFDTRKILDLRPHHLDAPLIRGISLHKIPRPRIPIQLLRKRNSTGSLPHPRSTCKKHIRNRLRLDKRTKALNNRLMPHNIRKRFRPILLSPDLNHNQHYTLQII